MQGRLTPPTADAPKYMTSREAARYLRIGRSWFQELVREGRIPCIDIPVPAGRTPMKRYDRDALDAMLATRVVNAATPATDPACDLDSENMPME